MHLLIAVPKELKHPRYGHLPDLETFAKSERERKVIAMFRNLRLTGSRFFAPPGTPADRIEILTQAISKTFKDPEFSKEYKKLVGDDPSPLFPEENQRAIENCRAMRRRLDFSTNSRARIRCRRDDIKFQNRSSRPLPPRQMKRRRRIYGDRAVRCSGKGLA
ncbi:MAG: hypothetical protein ACREQW_20905 [Candidatus Binatia bacterium]